MSRGGDKTEGCGRFPSAEVWFKSIIYIQVYFR